MDKNNLLNALLYAIQVIESYESDIRKIFKVQYFYDPESLVESGFCQGPVYKNAIKNIKEKAGLNE